MKVKKLLFFTIVFASLNVSGQIIKSKLDLVGGISAREYVHGGIRYQYSEISQFGVYFGNDLELRPSEKISTLSIDHMIHFGSLSFNSNRPVWYARQGFTLSKNNLGAQETRKYSYINLAAGRELAFNDWLGVNADLGIVWQVREKRERETPLETPINNIFRVYPLARIQIFLSF